MPLTHTSHTHVGGKQAHLVYPPASALLSPSPSWWCGARVFSSSPPLPAASSHTHAEQQAAGTATKAVRRKRTAGGSKAAKKAVRPHVPVAPHVLKRVDELRGLISRSTTRQGECANHEYYSVTPSQAPPTATPRLTDAEYDAYVKELKLLESTYPSLLKSGSPTQHPGSPALPTALTYAHTSPMLSLNSTDNVAQMSRWFNSLLNKKRPASPAGQHGDDVHGLKLCVELKYDGIALALHYYNGQLVRVLTRGDGREGEDITASVRRYGKNIVWHVDESRRHAVARQLEEHASSCSTILTGDSVVPAQIAPYVASGHMEVRGEILLTESDYQQFKAMLVNGGDAASNSPKRNVAAGLLRRDEEDNASEPSLPCLTFVAFSLHFPSPLALTSSSTHISPPGHDHTSIPTQSSSPSPLSLLPSSSLDAFPIAGRSMTCQSGRLNVLRHLGFDIAPDYAPRTRLPLPYTVCSASEVEQQMSSVWVAESERGHVNWSIDGLVLKLDDLEASTLLGSTSHHPRAALAYKFAPKAGLTTLLSIDYQVGRTGRITPVANLTPLTLDQVVISRATLHNRSIAQLLDLKPGDMVQVERRGDVIPYISGKMVDGELVSTDALERAAPCSSKAAESQHYCPCSQRSVLQHRAGYSDPFCESLTCPAQRVGKLVHYCSRSGVDIEGMGERTIQQLIHHGLILNVEDIIELLYEPRRSKLVALVSGGEMEGWADKKLQNLLRNIEEAHAKATPDKLLCALGVARLGASQARTLIRHFGDVKSVIFAQEHQFMHNVWPVWQKRNVSGATHVTPTTPHLHLYASGVKAADRGERRRGVSGGEISGDAAGNQSGELQHRRLRSNSAAALSTHPPKSVVLTGTFSMPRSKLEGVLVEAGYSVTGSVGRHTSMVIAGQQQYDMYVSHVGRPSKKLLDGEKWQVPILSEHQLMSTLRVQAQQQQQQERDLTSQAGIDAQQITHGSIQHLE